MTRFLSTIVVMVFFAAAPSSVLDAADAKKSGAYVSVFGGLAFPSSSSDVDLDQEIGGQIYYDFTAPIDDTGSLVGASAGYRFKNFRIEAELARRSNTTSHGAEIFAREEKGGESRDSCH